MNLKIIKEYKKQLALAKLSGNGIFFNKWWKSLSSEQRFELDVIHIWHARIKK